MTDPHLPCWWDCRDWVEKCLEIWNTIPNSPFWNCQWTAVLARVIKNCHLITWEPFLSMLFTTYLNMFQVSFLWCISSMDSEICPSITFMNKLFLLRLITCSIAGFWWILVLLILIYVDTMSFCSDCKTLYNCLFYLNYEISSQANVWMLL